MGEYNVGNEMVRMVSSIIYSIRNSYFFPLEELTDAETLWKMCMLGSGAPFLGSVTTVNRIRLL